jgi:hypothetical protein
MGGDKPDMLAWFATGVGANVTPGFERALFCGVDDIWLETSMSVGYVDDTFELRRGIENGRSNPARASKVELALG